MGGVATEGVSSAAAMHSMFASMSYGLSDRASLGRIGMQIEVRAEICAVVLNDEERCNDWGLSPAHASQLGARRHD